MEYYSALNQDPVCMYDDDDDDEQGQENKIMSPLFDNPIYFRYVTALYIINSLLTLFPAATQLLIACC